MLSIGGEGVLNKDNLLTYLLTYLLTSLLTYFNCCQIFGRMDLQTGISADFAGPHAAADPDPLPNQSVLHTHRPLRASLDSRDRSFHVMESVNETDY